jgi:hypothetical protein
VRFLLTFLLSAACMRDGDAEKMLGRGTVCRDASGVVTCVRGEHVYECTYEVGCRTEMHCARVSR